MCMRAREIWRYRRGATRKTLTKSMVARAESHDRAIYNKIWYVITISQRQAIVGKHCKTWLVRFSKQPAQEADSRAVLGAARHRHRVKGAHGKPKWDPI